MFGSEITLQHFYVSDEQDLFLQCSSLRRQVFCDEQHVEESIEFDGKDEDCQHIAAFKRGGGCVIATCRLRFVDSYVKLERVAVHKDWRKRYIGYQICRHAIRLLESHHHEKILVTYPFCSAIKFFENLGFTVISDEFTSAEKAHKIMLYYPRRDRLSKLDICNIDVINRKYAQGDCFDSSVIKKLNDAIQSFKEQNIPRLVHLQYLADENVIGLSLIRVYRECACATLTQNFKRSEELENFLEAMAWEKLNTGHYAEVNEAWRILYAIVMSCKAVRLKFEQKVQEALHACDMGLIMGRDVDGSSLSSFAHSLHSFLPKSTFSVLIKTKKLIQPPASLSNSLSIDVYDLPSFETMLEIMRKQKPAIITGLVSQWPAFTKWSFSYFNEIIGYRTVPVEIGSSYADMSWKQTLMSFHDFIEKFVENESPDGPGYFAQHRLFDQVPELLSDIIVPDYCALGKDGIDNVDMNIWIGPTETVSPLHFDPKSNIFCQVIGKKFLRMVPEADSKNVYPQENGILTNTSQVDVRNPDLTKFPLFAEAHVFDCVLNPGECLYIPAKFWHYVLALDPSISVSCWFNTEV
ncbi:unnamed protein product [Thelazia callipaeda]|uniref:JmjC domain-containing protein n=1 Tax=Thelazia callipaeda TaxID=103827 RepID=A0A0N5CVL0_THECL|nr:unnamed protein product [Thelazia callipaeda]